MRAHRQALDDCIRRVETHFGTQVFRLSLDDVKLFAQDQGLHSWVCMKPVVGLWQDAWRPYLAKQSIEFVQREWDQILYPFAKKGFFQFKKSAWDTNLVQQKT